MPFIPPRIFARYVQGTGWIPNEEDDRDLEFVALRLRGTNHDMKTLRSYGRGVLPLNQGPVPSCVAHSVAGAIVIREVIKGLKPVCPSRLALYFNARRTHDNPVKLTGTYLRACFDMMRKIGVCDEEYWPYSTKTRKINRRPSWKAQSMGWQRREGKYYAIKSYGDQRVEDICTAIDSGYPVCFGTPIDSAFMDPRGAAVVTRPDGDLIGGHAMLIVGYRLDPRGKMLFEVCNSWGDNWRDGGYVWFHEDWIRWSRLADLTIVRGWKRISKL